MAANGWLQHVRTAAKLMIDHKGFDVMLDKVTFLSAGEGTCRAQLVVAQDHLNRADKLHGGMTASLVDVISTLALMTTGKGAPGVSVDMHITYLNAAKPGDTIIIDATTQKAGRTLAFLNVHITEKFSGQIIAKGSHTKFVGN